MTWGEPLPKSGKHILIKARLDQAERAVLLGLSIFDLSDTYRSMHGYEKQDFSWYHPKSGNGFRPDHILASHSLNAKICEYLHHFRTPGLSDHSALEVVFDPIRI
jgi:exonuclease III